MGSISRVRADHFTNDDRVLRDKLVIGEDEAACAAIIEQGIREVQDTWTDGDRRQRLGHRAERHYSVPEIQEGQYGLNRHPGIGREK